MKVLTVSELKQMLLPALVVFLSLVLVLFASLQLEYLRHERMVPVLNAALARNGRDTRIPPSEGFHLLGDAAAYRASLSPSVMRFPLEKRESGLWVFAVHSGGISALFMMFEESAGQYSEPIPCDDVSARQARFLSPGLLALSVQRVKALAEGGQQ